ncbi:MAG: EVE domain-containing protein [Gemmataceae bacterium]
MGRWLFKEEPDHYSYDDLERDGSTVWSGVSNPLARKHLRSISVGDKVLYYHTGKEKAIVGIMKVVGGPEIDPNGDDDKSVVVTVAAIRRLKKPVTLTSIKADSAFAEWELVRQARLSVMPVPDELWQRVEALSRL